jgi:hypothetical protein
MEAEQKPNREITYQVGWKKGTIRLGSQNPPPDKAEDASGRLHAILRLMERYLWRPAPFVSERWLSYVLWAVPVVSFIASLALVFALVRAE